ncbi:MAG TPA: lac repressor, partial [Pantoea agglomerans]|nr:lac repressor [Pantoea agglomerans]
GAQSVERMLARLQGAEASDNALETTLVIRETTAPPADERINLVALSQQLQVIARRLAGK